MSKTPGRVTRASARKGTTNISPSLTSSFLQQTRNRSSSNNNLVVGVGGTTGSGTSRGDDEDNDEYQDSSNEGEETEGNMGLHLSSQDFSKIVTGIEADIPEDPFSMEHDPLSHQGPARNRDSFTGKEIVKEPRYSTSSTAPTLTKNTSKSLIMDTITQALISQIKPFTSPTVYDLPEHVRQKCEEAANQYIQNCKRFHISIDASVVTALQTGKCS